MPLLWKRDYGMLIALPHHLGEHALDQDVLRYRLVPASLTGLTSGHEMFGHSVLSHRAGFSHRHLTQGPDGDFQLGIVGFLSGEAL